MKKRNRRKKPSAEMRQHITFKRLYATPLPPAITARITPLLLIGAIGVVLTLVTLIWASVRGIAPFFGIITLVILGYATWLRYDVVSKGYKEILFKVIDYTYLTSISKSPTGMLLVKKYPDDADDRGNYHVAVSGKEDMPPIGWLVKVYVPQNMEPSEYNGRRFFPTVFGYKLEGEDFD